MRAKLTCVYRGHSSEDVSSLISRICEDIANEPNLKNLTRLCGSLSYMSLFMIPDYELTVGKAYTVENSSYYVDGIIKTSYHDITESFYKITAQQCNIPETLLTVLKDCAFGEAMSNLNVSTQKVYVALLQCYCSICKIPFTYNTEEYWYLIQNAFLEVIGL